MKTIIVENESFSLECYEDIKNIAIDILKELQLRRNELLDFLKIKECRKIYIKLFGNKNEFIKHISKFYKNKNDIPHYCCANIINGIINIYFDKNIKSTEYSYKLNIRNAVHEFVHILYNEYITNNRAIWLDEGLAMNLSKEREYLKKQDRFNDFYIKLKKEISKVNLKNLKHGENFANDNYNGYDISYLIVRYMLEAISNEEINTIIRDNNKVIDLEEHIIYDAINYFDNIKYQ